MMSNCSIQTQGWRCGKADAAKLSRFHAGLVPLPGTARRSKVVFFMLALAPLSTSAAVINVGLLPSWGTGWQDTSLLYATLASNWQLYGPHEVRFWDIDQPITNEGLAAQELDVIVLCNPSGGNEVYTVPEKDIILNYLRTTDCGAVGTYKFYHSYFAYDNSFLLEIFGLDGSTLTEFHNCTTGVFTILFPGHPLFYGISGDEFQSLGWTCSQDIGGAAWPDLVLEGTVITANTTDQLGIIAVHESDWRAVYCSTMPDYSFSQPGDPQLVYNMLVWAASLPPQELVPIGSETTVAIIVVISLFLVVRTGRRS